MTNEDSLLFDRECPTSPNSGNKDVNVAPSLFPHTAELETTLLRMEKSLESYTSSGKQFLRTKKEHVTVEIKPRQMAKNLNYSPLFPRTVYEHEFYLMKVTYSEKPYLMKNRASSVAQFRFLAPYRDLMHVRKIRSAKDKCWPVQMFALDTELFEVRFQKPSTMFGDPTQIILSDGYETVWCSSKFFIEEKPLAEFNQLGPFWMRFKKRNVKKRVKSDQSNRCEDIPKALNRDSPQINISLQTNQKNPKYMHRNASLAATLLL
eukprot:CAMPEP_0117440718 /NCGR_PEP_ID=MMETSP0759-20121206/3242_1 /TAXON_ID=63605 /ORGANISM="Percolomonas cosmopolitus, Strain WS" /LENGTH=262 /DNA_ID=CAMNT_0005232507 /DNA_START=158 /DNA_END=946 /DNA_ORIENTATION=-